MKPTIHHTMRARRLGLGLTQREAARRAGIQQRQVSLFERGGDVTLSTLLKLALALDMEVVPLSREDIPRFEALLQTRRAPAPTVPPPSLLDRYRVNDDEAQSNG